MTAPFRILIVDDSDIVRERLVRLLEDVPEAEVVGTACQAVEALDQFHQLHPDAVILDISMPEGSGIHVLDVVKRETPATRVLMLTNFAGGPYRETCLKLNADAFLDKSTEFERIPDILKGWSKGNNAQAA